MIEYLNPPSKSLLTTSCAKSTMASSCGEGKVAAPFTEGVSSSASGELAIDETASTVSLAPILCVPANLSVAVREGEECIQDFLDQLSGEESAVRHLVLGEEADDNDCFVDIVSDIIAVGDADSEGCTFADAPARVNLSKDVCTGCFRHISFAYMLIFSFPSH